MVNYNGLSKAEVLAELWNHSHCQGMSFLGAIPGHNHMTVEEAQELIDQRTSLYFDYVEGRVIKVDLRDDEPEFDERLYDRDCGAGMAQVAVNTAYNNHKEEL